MSLVFFLLLLFYVLDGLSLVPLSIPSYLFSPIPSYLFSHSKLLILAAKLLIFANSSYLVSLFQATYFRNSKLLIFIVNGVKFQVKQNSERQKKITIVFLQGDVYAPLQCSK
jgi:hypothetical protein